MFTAVMSIGMVGLVVASFVDFWITMNAVCARVDATPQRRPLR